MVDDEQPPAREWAPRFRLDRDELEGLLASVSDYLWSAVVQPDGSFEYRYYSPVVETITGRSVSFYLDGGWLDTIHADDLERIRTAAAKIISGELDEIEAEYRIHRADGAVRWVRDRVVALPRDDGTKLLNGVVTDVTERIVAEQRAREMEAALDEGQRLESLGLLAGGVAHDFNNLLVGVLGNLELALARLPTDAEPGQDLIEDLSEARSAALQCAQLCQQLLAYSGKGRFVIERFSLPELIEDMRRLLAASIAKSHALRFDVEPEVPAIAGDMTQFRQISMNLITNASEAIGDRGGTIDVRVFVTDADAEQLDGACGDVRLQPGRYVGLEVHDDGCGMDADTRARIFEPFFTTKSSGHGLGLAAVHGIVHGHGGAIWITSAPDRGTCFRLLFPPAREQGVTSSPRSRPHPVAAAAPTRGARVLVIDDEPRVRAVAGQMLELRGFSVVFAEDGEAGVEMFAVEHETLELVILDLTMPRLDGEAALQAIRAIDPGARVILTSGYNEASLEQLEGESVGVVFLQKPFRLPDLDRALHEVLGPDARR